MGKTDGSDDLDAIFIKDALLPHSPSLSFYLCLCLQFPLILTLLQWHVCTVAWFLAGLTRALTSCRNPTHLLLLLHLQHICPLKPATNQLLFLCSKYLRMSVYSLFKCSICLL